MRVAISEFKEFREFNDFPKLLNFLNFPKFPWLHQPLEVAEHQFTLVVAQVHSVALAVAEV